MGGRMIWQTRVATRDGCESERWGSRQIAGTRMSTGKYTETAGQAWGGGRVGMDNDRRGHGKRAGKRRKDRAYP